MKIIHVFVCVILPKTFCTKHSIIFIKPFTESDQTIKQAVTFLIIFRKMLFGAVEGLP